MTGTVNRMARLCREMGVPENLDPFHNLSFLSLAVIPELRITDRGIYSVNDGCFLVDNGA